MSKNISLLLKILISTSLASIVVYWTFKDIDIGEFIQQLEKVSLLPILLSVAVIFISHVLRAYRWNLLLEPLGHFPPLFNTTVAVLIAYIANLLLPRLGEISRCGVLNKTNKVPVAVGIGSVVTERLIDILALFLVIGLNVLLEYDLLKDLYHQMFEKVSLISYLLLFIGLVIFLVVVLLIIKKWSYKFGERIKSLYDGFLEGITSLIKIKKRGHFILSTVLMWLCYYCSVYLVLAAFSPTAALGTSAVLSVLVTGAIAITLPIQGGFGAYHVIVSATLLLYGVGKETGLFAATLLHTLSIFGAILFGLMALLSLPFLTKKKVE